MKVFTADKVHLSGGLQRDFIYYYFIDSFSVEGMLWIKFDGHIEH